MVPIRISEASYKVEVLALKLKFSLFFLINPLVDQPFFLPKYLATFFNCFIKFQVISLTGL